MTTDPYPRQAGTADSASTRIEDGIDTFVFRDGLIRVQTVRYTVHMH
jgi:hypothetical protein